MKSLEPSTPITQPPTPNVDPSPTPQPPPLPPPQTAYQQALLADQYRLQQKNYDSNVPYPHVQGGDALNDEFAESLCTIERTYVHLPKAYRIRIENWAKKLSSPMPTLSWRRNRNTYAHLLSSSIRNKDFREPFHRSPPDGPLQMLGAHLKVKAGEEGVKATNRFWAGIHRRVDRLAGEEGNNSVVDQSRVDQNQLQYERVDDIMPNQDMQQEMQQHPQPPSQPSSRQPTPSNQQQTSLPGDDDLTINTTPSLNMATSTSGISTNFTPIIRVSEIPTQTSRPPSANSVGSNNINNNYGMSTQTSTQGQKSRRGSRRNSRDLNVQSFEDGEDLQQSLLRTGFTPMPTIIHSPTVRRDENNEDENQKGRKRSVCQQPVGIDTPANASDSFVADMFPSQAQMQMQQQQQQQQQQLQHHQQQQQPHFQPPNPYMPTPAYQLTAPPTMPQNFLAPQNPPFPEPTTLPPELQELQHIVSAQTSRLQLLQDQLSSQQLAHALEIQRCQSQHVMEMQQLRKMHEQQLERFRLNHASGTANSKPGSVNVTGIPGQRKAWDASQLPLEEYLEYLDKFQQDATVLSTLAKQEEPLPGGDESFMFKGGGEGLVPY
ncbi:hypothetical protein TL16_g10276 [Triparma laevis f. inornata]|uniref:DUF4485 domain-containing protein n=1 Tax=Triparma laevis f. inornata TaxID=1714386 RepID=A0A9W7EQ55_9STRA|nr:hypothetical protein TL16_g10276 [Triparma laevis f. inornata]